MKKFGKYILFLISLFERREKFKTYFSLTINECIKIGYDSLFIVSIVSVFMGALTTIQTAFNLFGPLIPDYVISLGSISSNYSFNGISAIRNIALYKNIKVSE